MHYAHRDWNEEEEIELLRDIDRTDHEILARLTPKLSFIKIAFLRGDNVMAEGPVTLTVGQATIASVDGFDQNGAPFTGPIPTPTWSIDTTTFATIAPAATTPATEDVTPVAAGTANLTVTVTNAAGTVLTDKDTVTVLAAAPVLSSVKINFSTPR